jgi:hypothetical protein
MSAWMGQVDGATSTAIVEVYGSRRREDRHQPEVGERVTTRHDTKGTSLAKGPIGLLGLALLAYGITALIFGGHGFTQHAPTGAVDGKTWLGLEVNGWSGLLFVAAGLLLLLGAPMHWGAKGMSLFVGISLAVLSLIALANGHGALGVFAANGLTELVWAAAGALLIVLSVLPRVGGETKHGYEHSAPTGTPRVEPEHRTVHRYPARERTAGVDRQRPTTNDAPGGSPVAPVSGTSNESYDTTVHSR